MQIVEILLGEGGDVKLGDRTSKHIIVFLFGYLSTHFSFISSIALIAHLYICLIFFMCLHLY